MEKLGMLCDAFELKNPKKKKKIFSVESVIIIIIIVIFGIVSEYQQK
jgi:hypothetical protein